VSELDKALATLAAKLGTSVAHLWDVLLRQARVEIVEDLLFMLVATAFIFAWYRWLRSAMSRLDGRDDCFLDLHVYQILPLGIGGVASTVLFVFIVVCLFEIPTLLLNPEYWALQQVLGAVKP
jgi:hypothetical protein